MSAAQQGSVTSKYSGSDRNPTLGKPIASFLYCDTEQGFMVQHIYVNSLASTSRQAYQGGSLLHRDPTVAKMYPRAFPRIRSFDLSNAGHAIYGPGHSY